MTPPTSFRLRSGQHHNTTGPLALLAGQALEAARSGREVLIADSDGNTVAIVATPDSDHGSTVAITPVGPLQLFPLTPTQATPAWATRLAGLITDLQGDTP